MQFEMFSEVSLKEDIAEYKLLIVKCDCYPCNYRIKMVEMDKILCGK